MNLAYMFDKVKDIYSLISLLYGNKRTTKNHSEGIVNIVKLIKAITDCYFYFKNSSYELEQLDIYMSGATDISTFPFVSKKEIHPFVLKTSVAGALGNQYEKSELEKYEATLPDELLEIKKYSTPLDFSAETEDEVNAKHELWQRIAVINNKLFETMIDEGY